MSTETDAVGDDATARAEDLAAELGEAITDLPAYERFIEAKQAVEADEEAQEKIENFEEVRTHFMAKRQMNQATQEDVDDLQAAEEELHSLSVMEDFLEAKDDLVVDLETINEAVSDPLVFDFADKAGTCCEDEA